MQLLVIILALMTTIGNARVIDYCSKKLCNGKRHIGCNNLGNYAIECHRRAHLINIKAHREIILIFHNEVRNLIAGGGFSNYETAKRMATMQWDEELSQLAAYNVKQCERRYDDCRNTKHFRHVGQSLHLQPYTRANISEFTIRDMVEMAIFDWFQENDANSTSNPGLCQECDIGYFERIIIEHNIRIGCAASIYRKHDTKYFLMACNYATDTVEGEPLYTPGKPTTGCKTGRNPAYEYLCSIRERYKMT